MMRIPAIHTVYTGPKNQHGMRVEGHVLDKSPLNKYVLFTDNIRTTEWVRESSIEYKE